MKIATSLFIRNNLKHFSLKEDEFCSFLAGDKGEKKQLFAFVFKHYPAQFIVSILNDEDINRLENIEYLTLDDVHNFFGWRKYNVENWSSQKLMRLRKLWLHTPKCFVQFELAHLKGIGSFEIIFPRLPSQKICKKCLLIGECEGAKTYRSD